MEEVPSWQKKLITEAFLNDVNHGELSCAACHGTVVKANEEGKYHAGAIESGTFTPDPSKDPVAGCGASGCHSTLADNFQYSLHFTLYGEQNELAKRERVNSFDECLVAMQEGHGKECISCHATCGDCHVAKPNTVHGGLVNGHKFMKTPDQANNCEACHGSRVAVDFHGTMGHTEDGVFLDHEVYDNDPDYHNKPDVHSQFASIVGSGGNACLYCHDGVEMHSAVAEADRGTVNRYNYEHAASCMDCHSMNLSSMKNDYHSQHAVGTAGSELQCQVCHSQPYDNCNACHAVAPWEAVKIKKPWTTPGGTYQNENPYNGFRIAKNPLEDRSEDYALVRHIPVARDSYANWGVPESAYDNMPTWKYTTPHNILKWTPQTMPDTTQTNDFLKCSSNCHVNGDRNKNLFLTTSYLEAEYADEVEANRHIVMDGIWGLAK